MKRILLVCLIVLVSGCALPPNLDDIHPVGSKYTNHIKLGEKIIPLPDGEWEMAACGTVQEFFRMALVNKHSYGRYSLITIIVDKPFLERNYGYVNNKELSKKNIYHKVVKNNTAGKSQDAWSLRVMYFNFGKSTKHPFTKQLSQYLEDNNLSLAGLFVQISHRLTSWRSKKDYIDFKYNIDPTTQGLRLGTWKQWLPKNVNDNRDISDYIEHLKTVGARQHSELKDGVSNKL